MRILLLCHAFNSLTQRIYVDLVDAAFDVSVEFDISDAVTEDAVALFQPDLVIAPFLKRAIPESVFSKVPCFIVHPGPPGDRGPAALDWAVLEGKTEWGVTVLQAEAELDGGPVWAYRQFPIRTDASKGSLYRHEITRHAAEAVAEAIGKFSMGVTPDRFPLGPMRPGPKKVDRQIDWKQDDTKTVLRKLRSADGRPGVIDALAGRPMRLFDAHPAAGLSGEPGSLLATSSGAVCRGTVDGAVWLGHAKPMDGEEEGRIKLPTVHFVSGLPEIEGYPEIDMETIGPAKFIKFELYNGAMSVSNLERLRQAVSDANMSEARALVLLGGVDFWSNGMDLNSIEASGQAPDASWECINAIDDLVRDLIEITDKLTVSVMRGNAGAGGCFLALATDYVLARDGVILNPHYKNMGNLYGSEYWTYLLPRRANEDAVAFLKSNRLPISTQHARRLGLVDQVLSADVTVLQDEIEAFVSQKLETFNPEEKRIARAKDEEIQPLRSYRDGELKRMKRNFYGFDPSYHVARYNFVHDVPKSHTPLHLAKHRAK